MLRASVAAEKAGIPAVSIVATQFLALGRAVAKGLGASDVAIAEYPGVPMIDTAEELQTKVMDELLPQILKGLGERTQLKPAQDAAAEPQPRDIVFKGSLQAVQDHFDEQLWTDGLPVIPPTIASVEAFLRFTERKPHEVLAICLPEYREATIWNIAVNGVMAGCRPEYMPVLIAVVEAVTDPEFWLEDAGATPGWEPLIILSGPIIGELDFNHGTGVMRVGRRANTSIGRFLRLFMRNVAGQRIPPGATDKGSIGFTFNVVLPEDEQAVADMGWEPFSVDRGFAKGENVVTVQSCVNVSQPTYTGGRSALNHVQILAEVIGEANAYWSHCGIIHRRNYPLFVLGPSVAKAIADDGWTKDDIRHYLYENVKIPASRVEKYARNGHFADYDLKQLVARSILPPEYHESDDPDRLIRVFIKPEWIGIVVAGDPGRNQSKGYIQNHRQGMPVSKRIQLPADWKELTGQCQETRAMRK